jgi:hypothetical protein
MSHAAAKLTWRSTHSSDDFKKYYSNDSTIFWAPDQWQSNGIAGARLAH